MIKRETSQTLRKKGIFHTSISNEIAKSIKNPDALAIWVFLMTQSENYKIRANFLQKHFSLGDTRYKKAMDNLKKFRLLKNIVIRDERGRIIDNELECYGTAFEEEITEYPENRASGKSAKKTNTYIKSPDTLKTPNPVKNQNPEKPDNRENKALINNQIDSLIKNQSLPNNEKEESEKRNEIQTTATGRIGREFVALGLMFNHSHPDLLTLLNAGISEQEFIDAAKEAKEREISPRGALQWVCTTVKSRREKAEKLNQELKNKPLPNKNNHISTNAAYEEAIIQIEKRQNGADLWSHPAIFYAARALGNDLRQFKKGEIYPRWAKALDDALEGVKNGSLSKDVPQFVKNNADTFTPAPKNQQVLDAIRKGATLEQIRELAKKAS